jgi:membrane protease YdiL (CAAX protease family)
MPGTQELDVYRSDDFEEEVEKEGFHISPLGALAISLSFMALIPIILAPEKTMLMELIWILFIIGFAASRNAEIPTVLEFETTLDALWWGIPLGAIIAVVEVFVAQRTVADITNVPITAIDIAILVVSVGAVAEELLYRGGVYIPMRQYLIRAGLPTQAAILFAVPFQALIFSLGHMFVYETWNLFIALFVGGIMYGAAFEYKKDLTVPILAHLVVNLSGYREQAVGFLINNPLLLILIILFTVVFIFIKMRVG